MIDLYISSSVDSSAQMVAELLVSNNVECQVTNNVSSVRCDGGLAVESGYHIKIMELAKEEFKGKVWDPLEDALNLSCAFVRYNDEYMGCIRDWPRVFRDTACPSSVSGLDVNGRIPGNN
jgi:hypothetical protein